MSGVFGYRCSLVFTLQVAATPFHQGVLALNWQYAALSADTDKYIRSAYSQTSTNLPHVRFDLSSDTMVQLKVPFITESEYLTLDASVPIRYGMLALNAVLPIPSVVGISAPAYQIFVHLEDLEFFGALPNSTTSITLQAGKKLAPVSEEFESEAYPFSSSTMALSRSVKWLAKGIPMLSSVGGPTSWFLEKAAGAIRSFGFARPQLCDPTQRMMRTDNIGEQNVDVPAAVQVVGPISTNSLRVGAPFGGSEVDEMSLRYVLSQWSQVNYFPITTTDAASTLMYLTPISPSVMWFRSGASAPYCNIPPPTIGPLNTNSFQPSSLFFFASMFKLWRGSIKFRFTFAKTKMHGGRVMVAYNPQRNEASEVSRFGTKPALVTAAYGGGSGPDPFAYSAIFNLRDGNVFEFEVPYTNSIPYIGFAGFTGSLALYIVDSLQAPAVVSQTIHCLVEVCGGSDFELSNVRSPLYPVQPNPTLTLQSGKYLGNTPPEIVEYTIGDTINSVKQLISIPKVTNFVTGAGTKYKLTVQPWYYQPRPSVLAAGPTAHLTESFGFGGNISKCYTFVRGGTDFHAYMDKNNSLANAYITVLQLPYSQVTTTVQSPAQLPFSNNPRVITVSTGALHVRLPAYQRQLRFSSSTFDDATATGSAWGIRATSQPTLTYDNLAPMSLYQATMVSNVAQVAWISRAAADDAAMAIYIGPPPYFYLALILLVHFMILILTQLLVSFSRVSI